MKNKLLFGLLIFVLVALPLCAACEEEVIPPGEEEEEQPPAEEEEEMGGDWWDEFGEPQYGGTITYREPSLSPQWDTTTFVGGEYLYYLESLFMGDWTVERDPSGTDLLFKGFIPDEYYGGLLAESWERPDSVTIIINIREGVKWQDKEPVNGREFTAYDVEAHYNRMMDSPMYAGNAANWESVTATDNHTVVIKLKSPSDSSFRDFLSVQPISRIEAPEAVEAEGGALTDWTKAVGTGPWMLTDYVSGTSLTYSRNPDYWGYDERHPENQIPYVDTLKVLIIADEATAQAGLRAGQIDLMGGATMFALSYERAQTLKESNPELLWAKIPSNAPALLLRVDTEPFTDIRVRTAMQMAIDSPTIASEYYHGEIRGPAGPINPNMQGYCFAYEDWPQELKDEYSYNPERAIELLAEAAADGVFEPNDLGGFNTNVIAPTAIDPTLLLIFQSDLKDIGIDMDISEMDMGTFHAMAAAGEHDQMTWWQTSNTEIFMLQDYVTGAPQNWIYNNDPAYDQICNNILAAPDSAELKKAVAEADEYVLYQHWFITAGPTIVYTCWQPYLLGYSGEQLHFYIDQIFARCWIDQDLKISMGR